LLQRDDDSLERGDLFVGLSQSEGISK
jgi:hypothetical protein